MVSEEKRVIIASPAQTPSVWLLVPVLIVAKDRGAHGEYWCQKTNLFRLTIHLGEGDSDLQTPHCLVSHPWLV